MWHDESWRKLELSPASCGSQPVIHPQTLQQGWIQPPAWGSGPSIWPQIFAEGPAPGTWGASVGRIQSRSSAARLAEPPTLGSL